MNKKIIYCISPPEKKCGPRFGTRIRQLRLDKHSIRLAL